MKIDVRLLGSILLCVFAFSVVGCFLRREQDEEEPEEVIAALVSANPASGTLPVNGTITVIFDNPPGDVIASVGTVTVSGKTATITGPFTPGAFTLTITWADANHSFTYIVPKVEEKEEPKDVTTDPVDEPEEPEEPEVESADFVSANPPSGSTLSANGTISVTFDNPPGNVKASAGTISVTGKSATITGPFIPGAFRLVITWADKQHVLNYTVTVPDIDAPKVTGGTVRNGETDVDPDPINTNAVIEVTFNEAVEGQIALQNEAGNNVGWLETIEGNKAILELVRGRELTYETTYIIAGKVEDAAGNETDVNITFTTAPEPDTERPEAIEYIVPGSDGTNFVDTQTINNVGRIEFTFNEEIDGSIKLLTENGDNVGWIENVTGNKAILELNKGKELLPKTKYTIKIAVFDAAGNRTEFGVNFETTGGPPPVLQGMVRIPAGAFRMGSDGVDAEPPEKPVHVVHLDAFYIDEHEVTNAQYKAFILENPQWQKDSIDRRFHNGNYLNHWNGNNYPPGKDEHPVTYVSWYAAMAYAEWAGKRLPTEAEWEKAARGKFAGRKYPWGNVIDRNKANYNKHIGDTRPVGSYPANDYGLYDMTGNVWEWCLDEATPGFYQRSPRNNPIAGGPLKNIIDNFRDIVIIRIIRGGGWADKAAHTRVSYRFPIEPFQTSRELGFRCAFTP